MERKQREVKDNWNYLHPDPRQTESVCHSRTVRVCDTTDNDELRCVGNHCDNRQGKAV